LAPAEHARAKGYISTPSYSQVVQPVNQKAVGRWRAYERHLAPIIPRLQPYLQRWGYADRLTAGTWTGCICRRITAADPRAGTSSTQPTSAAARNAPGW